MIPISLQIRGFLSYQEQVELDFTKFDLACISGDNGAGKSSLLDAITWVLFGQARKRDDSLINLQSNAAEVIYIFDYEGARYRVQRTMPRGKKKLLEFQIDDNGLWRPLTEHSLRATQERIEETLRLDYETFVNAAFFLQGKADQFTQQNASKRKEVLSNILGLEIWEEYKTRAANKRRDVEKELDLTEGRIAEIDAELDEEKTRKARLTELENGLDLLSAGRKQQESVLEQIHRLSASLAEQRKLADALLEALTRSRRTQADLQTRLGEREEERAHFAVLLTRTEEIDAAYAAWKKSRETLSQWEETAALFHEQDAKRQPFLQEIHAEEARLKQKKALLEEEAEKQNAQKAVIGDLEREISLAKEARAEAQKKVAERDELVRQQAAAREKYAALQVENKQFKAEMDALKARIEDFSAIESATCPLCGQKLSEAHRAATLAKMEEEGKEKGDRYRANTAEMNAIYAEVKNYENRFLDYQGAEQALLAASTKLTKLEERLVRLTGDEEKWQAEGKKELAALQEIFTNKKFAVKARKQLTELDAELKKLGYDAQAHDAARQEEKSLRVAESEFHELEKARAALKPLDEEIKGLRTQLAALQTEVAAQEKKYTEAKTALDLAETDAPDENAAYAELLEMQEKENQLRDEVGAARQKVEVLADLKIRKSDFSAQREALARQIARYKKLERAFGRDGVPALLIEQALPEIEEKANNLLDRLSKGQMSIRFVTQAAYKDAKRADLKETLDIRISDSAGVRDYEMFSGGEAFRVNFAIRIALSQTLSRRKGARLQTLIIDEGFGSQDAQGRQRLIEAINQVRDDFAKILVITHLESLRDAFPNQILVEKGEKGSEVRVV
jgi:exonuclease SbcC